MFGRWCPPIDSQGAQVMPEAEELSVRPATHARTQMHSKCLAAACPHAQSSALALPKLQRALRPGVAPHAARRFSPQSCRADGSAPRALTQHTFPEPSGRTLQPTALLLWRTTRRGRG